MSNIPANISIGHVFRAIAEINDNGIPAFRQSTKFDLIINGNRYPPKYVISLANKYANGVELDPSNFSGGIEANEFLKRLGLSILGKENRTSLFPIESHSWRIISRSVFVKKLDKSSFLHQGTGIPMNIRTFFGIEDLKSGDKKKVTLVHKTVEYNSFFTLAKQAISRSRLFWDAKFASLLREELPDWFNYFELHDTSDDPPLLRLQAINGEKYKVEIINPLCIQADAELDTDAEPVYEGAVKYHYSKVYERKPENRKRAMEVHGLQCVVCGFDFERHFGIRGAGFIEIHHIKPLSVIGEAIVVNPETDLVPICSNCHRMIHRGRDRILTVEELKNIYQY